MRKLIVSEWISLDGVYDASLMDHWWNPYDSPARQQAIQQIINDCDCMLYGRKTYEMLQPYWSTLRNNEMGVAEHLNKVKKYVVSKTLKTAPWENTEIINKQILETIKIIKGSNGGNILVIGSSTLVATLLEAQLVDEIDLLIQPYIMGRGEHFFLEKMNSALTLIAAHPLDKGVMHLSYRLA